MTPTTGGQFTLVFIHVCRSGGEENKRKNRWKKTVSCVHYTLLFVVCGTLLLLFAVLLTN